MAGRTPGQRAGLSRQAILDAALQLVDREGLKALSMRRLGAELGVEAMTLYHYLPNKDALLDGLVEQVVAKAVSQGFGSQPWQTALRDYAVSLLAALLDHPQVIVLVSSRPATTPGNLGMVEDAMAVLRAAGFALRQAADVIFALSAFVVGQAVLLARAGEDDRGQLNRVSELDAAQYPLLAAAARDAGPAEATTRFDFALDAMLTGFAEVLARRQS